MTRTTVGIPFFNDASTLEMAVRSVFAQTDSDWELLLVDDGGDDGGLDRIRAIRDPRVTVLADGANRGLPSRLNQIAERARGEFLIRMDADDIMDPNRIRRQIQCLQDPTVDVVASRALAIDQSGQVYGLYRERPIPEDTAGWLRNGVLTHPTIAARSSWFRNHPYDETLRKTQDKDLWLRSEADTRFVKLVEPLLFYRVRGNVILRAYRANCHYDRVVIRRHGPRLVGSAATARALARSFVKEGLATGAYVVGAADTFQKRRVATVDRTVLADARRTLDHIGKIRVPGWLQDQRSSPSAGSES